ncbi:MAG: alpha-amylase family glycosyl hydrolase [Actinomycetota bacterium]
MTRVPVSTYRVQLHRGFGFADAAGIAGYLHDLGIGDLYASPILAARPGSTHGYDVADPTRLNPELGGEVGFERLTAALRERGMGLLVDIVPSHMAAGPENPWWSDVLERGRASPFASSFDIDWESPAQDGKVVLPLLGDRYPEVLERGELRLLVEEGNLRIAYFDLRLPVSPASCDLVLERSGVGAGGPARFRLAWQEHGEDRSRIQGLLRRISRGRGGGGRPARRGDPGAGLPALPLAAGAL